MDLDRLSWKLLMSRSERSGDLVKIHLIACCWRKALESTRPKTNSAQTKSAQNQLGPKPSRPKTNSAQNALGPGLRDPFPFFFSFLLLLSFSFLPSFVLCTGNLFPIKECQFQRDPKGSILEIWSTVTFKLLLWFKKKSILFGMGISKKIYFWYQV